MLHLYLASLTFVLGTHGPDRLISISILGTFDLKINWKFYLIKNDAFSLFLDRKVFSFLDIVQSSKRKFRIHLFVIPGLDLIQQYHIHAQSQP